MIEVEEYNIDGGLKQVCMVGEYVGVWWHFQKRMEIKTIEHDGIKFSVQVPNFVLTDGPLIGLLHVDEYISTEQAEQIAKELHLAIEYIKSL